MIFWQKIFLVAFILFNLFLFFKGLKEIKKGKVYGVTKFLFLIGIFVWGDAVILAPFWIIVSLLSISVSSWYLFLLFVSVYWTVRSLGETIYWLNHQFTVKDNSDFYKSLIGYSFFKSNAILFVYQIFLQCITVISIVATIYFANLWLSSRF
jgi:hypothetical protein